MYADTGSEYPCTLSPAVRLAGSHPSSKATSDASLALNAAGASCANNPCNTAAEEVLAYTVQHPAKKTTVALRNIELGTTFAGNTAKIVLQLPGVCPTEFCPKLSNIWQGFGIHIHDPCTTTVALTQAVIPVVAHPPGNVASEASIAWNAARAPSVDGPATWRLEVSLRKLGICSLCPTVVCTVGCVHKC
jgi:hypothetical protein